MCFASTVCHVIFTTQIKALQFSVLHSNMKDSKSNEQSYSVPLGFHTI